jgi:hypothetical protein
MEPTNPYATPSANPYGSNPLSMEGSVAAETIAPLAGTKGWVQFMSILLWIGVGFMILGGIGMMTAGSLMADVIAKTQPNSPMAGKGFMLGMGAMYLLMALFYVYPAIKLWSYGSRIGALKNSLSLSDLNAALHEQRRFWKFTGIVVIVMMCIYMLFIVGIGVAAGMAASRGM